MMKQIINTFQASNPQIKITLQIGNGTHLQKLNTELAGGRPPDIIKMWEIDYGSYAKKGVFYDLNEFIKGDQEFMSKVQPDLYPSLVDMFTWEGKFYVMPDQVTDVVLFYNKDLVAQAGLTMPTSWDDTSWTWSKFQDYATRLTRAANGHTSQYGYVESWWWPFTATGALAVANGGAWFARKPVDPAPGDSNLADPQIVNAVQWYADLSNVYHVAATNKSLQSQNGFQLFQTGKAAMTIVGHWYYDAFASTKGLHFDIAPLPIGPMGSSHSATNMGGNGVSISKQTKYPDEAWKFIRYYGGAEATAMRTIWVPTLKSVGASQTWKNANAALDHAELFTSVLNAGYVHNLPVSRAWENVTTQYGNVLTDIWDGKQKASNVLKDLDTYVNKAIQQYG
jgi:multiple sugar transport system substrate-binding protein